MKRTLASIPMFLLAISFAGAAWAGGSACSGKASGSTQGASATKSCPATERVSAGDHCAVNHKAATGEHCAMKSAQEADASHCGVKANQAMYSYAVPSAECGHCSAAIQKAAMAFTGVSCAHVDLDHRVAYIIADKGADKLAIAKTIQAAGYKCTFQGQGAKVEAAFAKAMASSKGGDFCCAKKDKDKV